MKDIFGTNGYLEEFLPGYEYRGEQVTMADFITECLYDAHTALIEAGTGTGKTLAYLIPALQYALTNEKRVMVSTETKALQKQLVDKDIPVVQKLFNEYFETDFKFALCLGSSNYLCVRRFHHAVSQGSIPKKHSKKAEAVRTLLTDDAIVTAFDIELPYYLWNEINREGDACNTYRCPRAGECVYLKARRKWQEANLLIVNHYLFFTNIASGKGYLPEPEVVIFDEAHSIEDIASRQLGFQLSYGIIMDIMYRFYSEKKRSNLLENIEDEKKRERSIKLIKEIRDEANSYFDSMQGKLGTKSFTRRLRKPIEGGEGFLQRCKEFMMLMAEVESDFEEEEYLRMEFDIARGRLFLFTENLSLFINQAKDDYVYWLEREKEILLQNVVLKGQPIDVSDMLKRELFSYYDSSILVSATLAVRKDFAFIVKRLGIEGEKSLLVDSSFDFKNNVLLYIGKSLHEPNSPSYLDEASIIASEIIKELQGNCLILFTSYSMLRDVKERLQDLTDYEIFDQDALSSSDALQQYVDNHDSVLMGTHSFWQGIDLPGDALRAVIMMRLPFSVPDSPPNEAKIEKIKQLGGNPFSMLQMPEAIIKFKQGFGRLIRSSTDKGVVAILDPRLTSKSYGKLFIQSIPECKYIQSIEDLKTEYSKMNDD